MIVPQGGIWQELRSSALDTIAPRTPITPKHGYSLSQWLGSGYYLCSAAGQSAIALEASTNDIGAALLGDAEYFLDQAAEHKATALSLIRATDWTSPSWLLVTVYYWAYFSALALSRLTGGTAWFSYPLGVPRT